MSELLQLNEFNRDRLIVIAATYISGVAGALPDPPEVVKRLRQHEWFKYLMLFTLLYQGGAEQDVSRAAVFTAGTYAAIKVLNYIDQYLDDMQMKRAMQQKLQQQKQQQ